MSERIGCTATPKPQGMAVPRGFFLRSQLRLTGEAVCRALLSIQSFADTKQQQAADDVSHDREQELLKNWMH